MRGYSYGGNGTGKHVIHVQNVAPEYVVFVPDSFDPVPPNLSIGMHHTVQAWYSDLRRVDPDAEISAVLPIVENGGLIALHVWLRRRSP